jgi:RNA polymerase sigma-70 factor (ECF subfamily)
MSLSEAFLSAAPAATRPHFDRPERDDALRALWSATSAEWPQLTRPAEVFVAFLASHLPADARSLAIFGEFRLKEMFLTCACARGDTAAIRLLETHYFPVMYTSLRRMRLSPTMRQEASQIVRERLFVSHQGQRPRIARYSGRGELGSWLSVSAVRAACRLLRKEQRHSAHEDDDLLQTVAAGGPDVETSYIQAGCRDLFRASFREALATLDTREKNLLRQHYLDGLTLDQIALLYQAHRGTAARWLQRARKHLYERTHAALRERLDIPDAERDSFIRMAQSQMEMTFGGLFSNENSQH